LDRLWSPWRSEYIAAAGSADKSVCVFCELKNDPANDRDNFVVHRAQYNFVALNRYPYTSGHLLIIPYEHIAELDQTPKNVTDELMDLTKTSQKALRDVYQPDAFNVGMNLGEAAGAGIAAHLHIHILPRWFGDTNFMTAVGETRVLPEDLATTYGKLQGRFEE